MLRILMFLILALLAGRRIKGTSSSKQSLKALEKLNAKLNKPLLTPKTPQELSKK